MRNGIDVSYHQGTIDWGEVKASGIDVAIIRAGYRTTVDKQAKINVENAIKNGIDVGLYWFIYVDSKTIEQNAQAFISFASQYKGKIKHKLWADWEYDTEKKSPVYNTLTRSTAVRLFCEIVKAEGYDVGIYSNMDYIKSGKFTQQLIADYPLWFARYTTSNDPGIYSKKGKCLYIWQYTSKGSVNGIRGDVDCNRVYNEISAPTVSEYYPVPTIRTGSIVSALNNIKEPSTISYRKKIAEKNGISNYAGLYDQNVKMLELLKNGKLKKV